MKPRQKTRCTTQEVPTARVHKVLVNSLASRISRCLIASESKSLKGEVSRKKHLFQSSCLLWGGLGQVTRGSYLLAGEWIQNEGNHTSTGKTGQLNDKAAHHA